MTTDPPSPGSNDALGMRAALRDMELNQLTYCPRMVRTQDGRMYLVRAGRPEGMVDEEPYPRLTPQARLAPLGDVDLDASVVALQNAAAISRLSSSMDEFGLQALEEPVTGAIMMSHANLVGISPVYDFQVIWSGAMKEWIVSPGLFAWVESSYITGVSNFREVTIARTKVPGRAGWICLPVSVQPESYDSSIPAEGTTEGYTMAPGTPHIVSAPASSPPRRAFGSNGGIRTWSPGQYELPIAYVEPPNGVHVGPLIQPWTTGPWVFLEGRWFGSLPLL